MKIEDVKKLSPQEILLYWIRERESIRRKKELGLEMPWTDDSILDMYRFCNVRRMDDKVSQWLMKNWYGPFKNHPNIILAATLARQLNSTDSLEAVGFPNIWTPSSYERVLNERVKKGLKNFSAAYMITGTLGGTKIQQIIRKVADGIYRNPPEIDSTSMEKSVQSLLSYKGFSTFIAGQVVADLRWAMTGTWKDRYTWAPMGPGSKRGLNRLHDRPFDAPMREKQFLEELRAVIELYNSRLPSDIVKRLEAQDVQSTLCEFDKYTRALTGDGRPKQLYRT